jgi:hypothetical protein
MIFELNETTAVKFDFWKQYQVTSCIKKNGIYYPIYAKFQIDKFNYHPKDWPVQVKLGTKEQVVQMCLAILQEVTGMEYEEKLPV